MGVGRRMKKQGMPPTLQDLGIEKKRKASNNTNPGSQSRKRRKSEDEVGHEPKKLVNLDRAIRLEKQEDEETRNGRGRGKKPKLVDNDAQITVPPQMPALDDEVDEDAQDLNGSESQVASSLSSQEDANMQDEFEELDSDSVFDSEEEKQPQRMFSDDEEDSDALETLTAANIEGLSRKLDAEQAQIAEEAQAELEEDAMQTNIAGDGGVLDGEDLPSLAPDLQLLRSRLTETIRILGDYSKLADPSRSRAEYTQRLLSDICQYYGYTPYLAEKLFNLFTPAEAFAFFEANETPRPVVLRTNTLRTNRRTLAQSLINRGVVLEPVGKWSKVGLQVFESPVPLGATPEYLAGHYILQAASSFLPVMALAPQPGERVLDMAAAPGGKTTYISALMRNTGVVFANDANRQRAKGLIGNIHRLGCKNTVVCHYDAVKAFPKALGGFDRILLDAPCTGTGVIGKDPSVKTSKTERDFLAVPHMQRQLLLAAIDSVDHASKTGGYVVYSTCSVTVEENEAVVQYILRKRPNVKVVDTGLGSFGSEGFRSYMGKQFDENMKLTRRYFPHRENVDGFFVCKLKKTGPIPKTTARADDGRSIEEDTQHELSTLVDGPNGVGDGLNGTEVPADEFGGFNDEEDQEIISKAEKKWRRARGLDPRGADHSNPRSKKAQNKPSRGKPENITPGNKTRNAEALKSKKERRKERTEDGMKH